MNSAVAKTALRSAIDEPAPTARLRGLQLYAVAALLAVGDASALPMAERELLAPDASLPSETLPNLRSSLARGVFGTAGIPELARLLEAGDAETRRAAATALGRSKLRSAAKPLVSGLDDADFKVALAAVHGLAKITGQLNWAPSDDAFRADRRRYVDHWKEWARDQ